MKAISAAVIFCVTAAMLFGCVKVTKEKEQSSVVSIVSEEDKNLPYTTLTFNASDGLKVTADFYLCKNSTKHIILFHQAGWSRGEFREIALRFVKMGYNALAVDLRSGKSVNGVINETAKQAKTDKIKDGREDAYLDMIAALDFINKTHNPEKLILLGSSYSASLVLILGNDAAHKGQVDGIIAMSPGEYVKMNGKTVEENVVGLDVPTFITSGKSEFSTWEKIAQAIGDARLTVFKPEANGDHGAKALWETSDGFEEYWKAIGIFIERPGI